MRTATNRYAVTLRRAGADGTTIAVTVRVQDRDEPGRAVLRPWRPVVGEPVTVSLTDPDRADTAPAPTVQWERWRAPGEWQAIPQATGLHYTPAAADAGRPLRAVVSYADRHGPDRQAVAELPNPVVGPMLSALTARTDSARSRPASEDPAPRPAFDPRILHYGVRCDERDVMTVSFSAPPGVRVSVNGIQPRPGQEGSAAVPVTPTSDVAVTVAAPGRGLDDLHAPLHAGQTVDDPHRARSRPAAGGAARTDRGSLGGGPRRARRLARPCPGRGRRGGLLPASLRLRSRSPLGAFRADAGGGTQDARRAAAPLAGARPGPHAVAHRRHGSAADHDGAARFPAAGDGSTLLMTYEPSVRDLRGLSFPDGDGKPWGAGVEMKDSAIQLRGPDGAVRWTWSSWGRLPLEDCAQHRFPGDWAHVNSIEWTDEGVLASFRGCSTIVMIDPAAPPGEEIVWRIGASNLDPEDWQRRGLGPPPLRIVGDPEGAFCGQHAAQLLPAPPGLRLPRLLLFDNGVACVVDPRTGKPLGRKSGIYSRAVEYALRPGARRGGLRARPRARGRARHARPCRRACRTPAGRRLAGELGRPRPRVAGPGRRKRPSDAVTRVRSRNRHGEFPDVGGRK